MLKYSSILFSSESKESSVTKNLCCQCDSTVHSAFSAKLASTTSSTDPNITESIETHDQTPAATDFLKPRDAFHKIIFL